MPVTLTIPQKIKWDCSLKVVYESEYSMHLQGRLSEVEFQQCLQSLSEASSAHRMSWGELIFYIVGMSALGFLGLGAVGLKVISGDYFAIVFAILSTVLSLLLIVCVIGLIVRTRTIANQRKEAVKKVLESLNQIHNSMGLNWRYFQKTTFFLQKFHYSFLFF